jgi:hypothetical protein
MIRRRAPPHKGGQRPYFLGAGQEIVERRANMALVPFLLSCFEHTGSPQEAHTANNGSCVRQIKARSHRHLVTVVGHTAIISSGKRGISAWQRDFPSP